MNLTETPKVIWVAVAISALITLLSIYEIVSGNFQLNDAGAYVDLILGILGVGLIFRIRFIYIMYVVLVGIKLIAGIALITFSLAFSYLDILTDQTALLWIGGIMLLWVIFYWALRRPYIKEWYRAGSNKCLKDDN